MSIQNSPRRIRKVLGITKLPSVTSYHADSKPLSSVPNKSAIDIIIEPAAGNTGTTYIGWEEADDTWLKLTNGSQASLRNGAADQGLSPKLIPFDLSRLHIKSVGGVAGDSCKVLLIETKIVDRSE